jgi:hypothetical protein
LLPQYRTNSTLSDFNDISYVGRLWCPEFIPDIVKFLAVAIFKMVAKIQHCPISSTFDMWVDNDVPSWFPTLKIFRHLESESRTKNKSPYEPRSTKWY